MAKKIYKVVGNKSFEIIPDAITEEMMHCMKSWLAVKNPDWRGCPFAGVRGRCESICGAAVEGLFDNDLPGSKKCPRTWLTREEFARLIQSMYNIGGGNHLADAPLEKEIEPTDNWGEKYRKNRFGIKGGNPGSGIISHSNPSALSTGVKP